MKRARVSDSHFLKVIVFVEGAASCLAFNRGTMRRKMREVKVVPFTLSIEVHRFFAKTRQIAGSCQRMVG